MRVYKRSANSCKGQQRQCYQSNEPPAPNSVPPSATTCTFPALCPPLFTTPKHGRVNYGEAGFHKFWDEIWSDKFNSQDPAPRSRRAQVTRVDAHKYMCSRTRALHHSAWTTTGLQIIICMPTSCCDKRTTLPARLIPIRMRIRPS